MSNLKDKNILVTGGTGFVGSHLIEELIKNEANIITTFQTLNPLSYFITEKMDKKVTIVNCDVSDFEKVFDIVSKFQIDYIFHLAAQPLVDVAYANPKRTLYSNILGTVNVCESARLFPKVKAVVVASSDKAYGKLGNNTSEVLSKGARFTSEVKYLETNPLRGDHPYEVSKSSADLIAYSYFKTYQVPVVITRFGNIYGEGDLQFSRIIPGIIKSVVNNELLEIRSDGSYIRDYLYVKDVVDGYLLSAANIEKVKGEAFNFGSDETLSVLELMKLVEKTLNKKIKYEILNIAKNEIPYQSLDYSKLQKMLNWKPKYSISKTIKTIYSWYKNTIPSS